jgi:hypothetical protein
MHAGYFWLRPALSVLEFNQSLTQALPAGCVFAVALRAHCAARFLSACQQVPPREGGVNGGWIAVAYAAAARGCQPGEEAEPRED